MAPAVPVIANEQSQLSIQQLLEHLTPQQSLISSFTCGNVTPITPSRSREHPCSLSGIDATPVSSPGLFERTDGLSSLPPSSPLRSPTVFSSFARKKAKVTKKNPAWGFVGGAMRGSKKLEIIRPQALRKRMEDQAASTKRFHREIGALIARAERLSEETGCWLAVMAQHGNAGSSATHFTSSSLRRDAKEDTVSLINQFHSITRALLVTKRQGALEMAKRLVEAEESAVDAQATLAAKQAQLTEALVLLAQHGIAGPSVSG
ncbi:hypothetical protein F5887DRAFT_1080617 [Amanita rubescens]|nr:hypothetical protein F5887DRAFT_1080617 [Amanita rubescens]